MHVLLCGLQLGGSAFLHLENDEMPYLHGIKYTAIPPSKRFRDMDQLSGAGIQQASQIQWQ